jgi:hypothetical protein
VTLRLAFCSPKAARYAVMQWHYSKRMPLPPLVKVGVWEDGEYIGVVLFGRGAAPSLGKRFGLNQTEWCELVRVALRAHKAPVTRIIRIAFKLLRESSPNLRLVVSFADPAQGHHGGIYQAGGWFYVGDSAPSKQWWHDGRWKHNREITYGYGVPSKVTKAERATLQYRISPGKHRYAYPLDPAMRPLIESMSKPYPKKMRARSTSGDPADQAGEGGAKPTRALHLPAGDPCPS